MPPRLISIKQGMQYLSMSKKQFYAFAARAGLQRIKPGAKKYWYDRTEIDAAIEKMKTVGKPA